MAEAHQEPEKTAAESLRPQISSAPDGGDGGRKLPFLGFVGSFAHSIDAKGRMIIPAPFREPLGDRFAVAPSPDFQTVALYPIDAWLEKKAFYMQLAARNPKAQPFLEQFSKYSFTDCESDAQGRLLLPQKIRSWRLGDARDVEVDGAFTYIRILPAAKGRDQDRAFDDKFADPLQALSDMQREAGF